MTWCTVMAHLIINYCRLYHILTYRLFQNCICHKFRICNTYLLSPPILSPGIPSSHDYIYTFLWIDTRVPPLKKGTVSHIFLVFHLWASKTKIDLDKNLMKETSILFQQRLIRCIHFISSETYLLISSFEFLFLLGRFTHILTITDFTCVIHL